jgi:hypothetical protein
MVTPRTMHSSAPRVTRQPHSDEKYAFRAGVSKSGPFAFYAKVTEAHFLHDGRQYQYFDYAPTLHPPATAMSAKEMKP